MGTEQQTGRSDYESDYHHVHSPKGSKSYGSEVAKSLRAEGPKSQQMTESPKSAASQNSKSYVSNNESPKTYITQKILIVEPPRKPFPYIIAFHNLMYVCLKLTYFCVFFTFFF